jgi:hypothetical protein
VDLLDAIEQNRPTRTPMIEGARTLELVLAANRAGETGEVVRLTARPSAPAPSGR